MPDDLIPVGSGEALADVALYLQDLVLDSPDIQQFLEDLALFSASRLSSPEHEVVCGIPVIRRKKVSTVASSNPAARIMDETQNTYGDGPSLTAMREVVTVHVPDLLRESIWPAYITAVGGRGEVHSCGPASG